MTVKKIVSRVALLVLLSNLAGCSVIPTWMDPTTWFEDDKEAEVRELKPINERFKPAIVWDDSVGDGVDYYFSRLTPVVAYNKVFAASRQGIVKAFDETSGKQLWKIDLADYRDEGMFSSVTQLWADGISARLSGGITAAYQKVFLGSENGLVFAIDVDTGKVAWQSKVKGEVLASPAVDEGVVVVNTGAGVMHALDAETGEQRWIYESEVPTLTLRGVAQPSISSGGAIVGTASGKVAVVLIENGQVLWEQTVAAATGATELERLVDIDSQTLVFGGIVYVVSYNGTLAAVELRSGRVLWKREYRSYRRMTIDGNLLYVVDASSQVYALDRRNGIERWSQPSLRERELTSATPVSDYIVVGDRYGFLHWLDKASGEIVARLNFGGDDEDNSVYVEPVVSGDIIYAVTREGDIAAIRTP
ncbi:outer membrane protein assembly factor BamB [Planctobacterium marinum]|uniref:outer membrane protein assembly factor BamB n=1 Tax=Planctobacterium marinum TaxID=1631968 RepID=UPI001E56DCEB|nr:outer membrane protein assembly factor BamB [Planctobacterium marinum]MCC2606307.1 outer membrane protein assembly factor BamB [Planctobacterium marinum]